MNIELLRKQKNLTQTELAKSLGVSQANISQWENGVASPAASKLTDIANILGCKIDDLFENKGNEG